jgi:hypothetical protein
MIWRASILVFFYGPAQLSIILIKQLRKDIAVNKQEILSESLH